MRVGRGKRVLALMVASGLAVSGCAHTHEGYERRITELEKELTELKRSDRSAAVRLEEVENRLVLIDDALDTRRTVLYRDRGSFDPSPYGAPVATAPPYSPPAAPAYEVPAAPTYASPTPAPTPAYGGTGDLPTVRLAPPEPAPTYAGLDGTAPGGDPLAAEPAADPFTYDKLDGMGYVVPTDTLSGSMEEPSVSVAPPTPTPPVEAVSTLTPKQERRAAGQYRKAYELVKKKKFSKATKRLEKFVKRYPQHPLTDNALYWLGECLYAQKKFMEALQAFQRVVRDHPDGNKVPDAMLKTGLCYQNLGETGHARRVLLQVAEIYPTSGAARIASDRVRTLQ